LPEFIDRMKIELGELTTRIDALDKYIYSEHYYSVARKQQYLLCEQLYPMREYQRVLRQRIANGSGWVEEEPSDEAVSY
jgi:hypothetical protein